VHPKLSLALKETLHDALAPTPLEVETSTLQALSTVSIAIWKSKLLDGAVSHTSDIRLW